MKRAIAGSLFVTALVASAGCVPDVGTGPSAPTGRNASSITVTSKSFASGGPIPVDMACDGKNVSPQLTWSSPPEGTKALVLVVDDPDAQQGVFTHWLVLDLPATELALAEAVDPTTLGAKVAQNDFHNVRYDGPCPPRGDMHRYQFHVYATDCVLPLTESATRADVDAALSGHVIGAGVLVGTFSH